MSPGEPWQFLCFLIQPMQTMDSSMVTTAVCVTQAEIDAANAGANGEAAALSQVAAYSETLPQMRRRG